MTVTKKQWTEALRSGKYSQTTGRLRNSDEGYFGLSKGYCCLGVLCDVINPEAWNGDDWKPDSGPSYTGALNSTLVENYTNMKISNTTLGMLMDMNDDKELSFKEIAKYISKNVKVKK